MRLALIASLLLPDTRGGAEAYVERSARVLAERHDVLVLTGSSHTVNGVATVRIPSLPMLDRTKPALTRVVWHALDQWRPSVHAAVSRELKGFEPDVVVTHQPQGLSAAVFTAIAAQGLPHVHTAHDLNLLCARMSMTRDGEFCGGRCVGCRIQRTFRAGAIKRDLSRLIGVSRYICERHVRAGVVPRERATAVRLGANPGTSRLRSYEGGTLTLGYIGALEPHKGVRTLLEAMSLAADEPWQLLVAGEGHLRPEVERAASLDRRIEYLGHLHGDPKDAFFDRCDLIVIPSEWEEPATFVAVEAAVRGLPMAVSARGGLTEAPEARTFRSGDPEELLGAIRWYLADPRRLEDTSARLLAARPEFEWSTHVSRLEELLEDVRSEGVPPAHP
jgi:glycosyltransferase involved in cell wall biosynthesis